MSKQYYDLLGRGSYYRSKSQTTDDQTPNAILGLAATKTGKPAGNTATGGSTTTVEDTGTWTADELIGGVVMILSGDAATDLHNPRGYVIEDNDADSLTFAPAAKAAVAVGDRYLIEAAGFAHIGSQIEIDVFVASSGTCSVTLWRWNGELEQWVTVAAWDNVSAQALLAVAASGEYCVQITNATAAVEFHARSI